MSPANYTSPVPNPQTEHFWKAASDRTLLIPRCRKCGRCHWYPRPFCPHCYASDVVWEAASGRAKVYSFSVIEKDKSIVAYVQLEEGPIVLTNIVGTDPLSIQIGSDVTVTFQPSENGSLIPLFSVT